MCILYGPCRRFVKDNERLLGSVELEAPACQDVRLDETGQIELENFVEYWTARQSKVIEEEMTRKLDSDFK
jgi:hypothetical protein